MSSEMEISKTRDTWEAAAPGWSKWEQVFSGGLVPATDILLDMAGVRSGSRVLDLACGAGHQTLQAAHRVGPEGAITACDISEAMLEEVRRKADAAGLSQISTLAAAAEKLAAEGELYDAAICRLGLMLFPGPAEALATMHRVLKPSSRFAALVFTTPANNPFMAEPMKVLLRHAGKQPPPPGKPGIFALGGEGVLQDLLSSSGFTELEMQTVRAPLMLDSAEQALEMIQQAFGAYRAVIADLDEKAQADAWADVHTCIRQFESNEGFRAEFEFLIGAGTPA